MGKEREEKKGEEGRKKNKTIKPERRKGKKTWMRKERVRYQ